MNVHGTSRPWEVAALDKAGRQTLIVSVQRALHLLDAVGSSTKPAAAKKLARSSGLPLATTYHLLRTLVHEGYLRKLPDGYILGDRIQALSMQDPVQAAVSRARPVLQALRDELRGAAYLSLFSGGEIVLVDVEDGPLTPRVDLWVGFDQAAHATALGKCVLACLEPSIQEDYLSRHRPVDLTPRTLTDPRVLLRTLRTSAGVATDYEEYLPGTACLGVPVRAPGIVGAVAVSVPSRRMATVLARQAALQRAGSRVSRALVLGR